MSQKFYLELSYYEQGVKLDRRFQRNSMYGFMDDKGTRNAIFVMRLLDARAMETQKDLYICFIDYTKAFDKVRYKKFNVSVE